MLSLANKNVVVTAASSDFGRSLCVRLAESGARVFGTARTEAKAVATQDYTRSKVAGARIEVFALDLRSVVQIAACADAVAQRVDRVDVLIHNAALWLSGQFDAASAEAICETIASTFTGSSLVTKHFMPLLAAAGAADIVNISSESAVAWSSDSGHESYAAAKRAMDVFGRRVRSRVDRDLRVTTIFPPRFFNLAAEAEGGWQSQPSSQPEACMTSRHIWNAVSFALSQDRACSIDQIHLSNNPTRQ